MILGNDAILEAMDKGLIRIEPFNKDQLQGCSYDLRLDSNFIFWDVGKDIDPSCDCVKDITYRQSYPAGCTIEPYERILATTIEKVGSLTTELTTQLYAKSSFARWGLEVCSCAGFGDPGFASNWTLEIFNKNRFSIVLKPSMIIAQIAFTQVVGCSKIYKSKYNNKDTTIFNRMLPKNITIAKSQSRI